MRHGSDVQLGLADATWQGRTVVYVHLIPMHERHVQHLSESVSALVLTVRSGLRTRSVALCYEHFDDILLDKVASRNSRFLYPATYSRGPEIQLGQLLGAPILPCYIVSLDV